MNTTKLAEKVAVVTGASNGIGAAIAKLKRRRSVIDIVEHFQTQHALQEERETKLGHDLGDKIEILFGLNPAEPLAANPSGSLREGAEVKIQPQPTQAKNQG
jgi:NAD(P)-dependent dehydrogenase (short-subunit alcohol dehydrogenase family)